MTKNFLSYENDLINTHIEISFIMKIFILKIDGDYKDQADFSYEFDRYIRGLDFDFFVTRNLQIESNK